MSEANVSNAPEFVAGIFTRLGDNRLLHVKQGVSHLDLPTSSTVDSPRERYTRRLNIAVYGYEGETDKEVLARLTGKYAVEASAPYTKKA